MLNFENTRIRIPVSFEYRGKNYEGIFHRVQGGGATVWHLMINDFYYGRLTHTGKWIFSSNSKEMEELADCFGGQIEKSLSSDAPNK